MACCVAVGPETLLKMRAVGLRERPGSGLPNPVRGAVTGPMLVGMVRVPARGPVPMGLKMTLMKQEAFGSSGPLQMGPPVGAAAWFARLKLPAVVGVERETTAVVRFVRMKSDGALVLLTGTGPKSWLMGVITRPLSGMPVPVRVKGDGIPEVVEVNVKVAA